MSYWELGLCLWVGEKQAVRMSCCIGEWVGEGKNEEVGGWVGWVGGRRRRMRR